MSSKVDPLTGRYGWVQSHRTVPENSRVGRVTASTKCLCVQTLLPVWTDNQSTTVRANTTSRLDGQSINELIEIGCLIPYHRTSLVMDLTDQLLLCTCCSVTILRLDYLAPNRAVLCMPLCYSLFLHSERGMRQGELGTSWIYSSDLHCSRCQLKTTSLNIQENA